MRRRDELELAKVDRDIARAVLEVTSWPPQTDDGPLYSQIMAARLKIKLCRDLGEPVEDRVYALAAHPLPSDQSPYEPPAPRRRGRWWHLRRR